MNLYSIYLSNFNDRKNLLNHILISFNIYFSINIYLAGVHNQTVKKSNQKFIQKIDN